MKRNTNSVLYLSLSITVFFLLGFLILFPVNESPVSFQDKTMVSISLVFCYLLGLFSAIKPGWKQTIITQNQHYKKSEKHTNAPRTRYTGHHPDCDRFKSHKIKSMGKTMCAGCLGLSIGCIISILLIPLYLFVITDIKPSNVTLLFFIGLFIVSLSFLNTMISYRSSVKHVLTNSFLGLGFLFITIAILEATGKVSFALMTILFSFLWLDARIQLSSLHHQTICATCIKNCKRY